MEGAGFAAATGIPALFGVIAFGSASVGLPALVNEEEAFLPALRRHAKQVGASDGAIGVYKHAAKVISCGALAFLYSTLAMACASSQISFTPDTTNTSLQILNTSAMALCALSFVCAGSLLRLERWRGRRMQMQNRIFFFVSFCGSAVSFAGTSGIALALGGTATFFHLVLACASALWPEDLTKELESAVRADMQVRLAFGGFVSLEEQSAFTGREPLLGGQDAVLKKKGKARRKFKSQRFPRAGSQDLNDAHLQTLSSWSSFNSNDVSLNPFSSDLPNALGQQQLRQQEENQQVDDQQSGTYAVVTSRPRVASDPLQRLTEWDGSASDDQYSDNDASSLFHEEEYKAEEDQISGSDNNNSDDDDSDDEESGIYDVEECNRAKQAALAVLVALTENPDLAIDHRRWLIFTYEKCFRGHRLIELLLESGKAADKKSGVALAKSMIKHGFIERLTRRSRTFRGQDELVRLSANLIKNG